MSQLYKEERPWGNFTVLQDMPHYKLKVLTVAPDRQLSLQMHYHREEHWIVSKGQPQITVSDKTWQAKTGEYIHIPKEAKHRLSNFTNEIVELIEVQQGDSFAETDIVRFEDDFNRA